MRRGAHVHDPISRIKSAKQIYTWINRAKIIVSRFAVRYTNTFTIPINVIWNWSSLFWHRGGLSVDIVRTVNFDMILCLFDYHLSFGIQFPIPGPYFQHGGPFPVRSFSNGYFFSMQKLPNKILSSVLKSVMIPCSTAQFIMTVDKDLNKLYGKLSVERN